MEYLVSNIVEDVKVALDRNNSSTALADLGDLETLSLDALVRSKIEDAARVVAQSAPVLLLGSGKPFGDSIGWDMAVGYGPGHIVLPDDFLRLIVFQMSDWSQPVTTFITETSPEYAKQRSRFSGVRGTPQRPVVAIINEPVGKVLEFYSCAQGAGVYIKMAHYLPIPKIETNDDDEEVVEYSEFLYRGLVYYAAYLVALTIQNTDLAKSLYEVCKEYLGTK